MVLIINDNTYFLVSLPILKDFAPGDALLYPLADEVGPRATFDDLNKSWAPTNCLKPQENFLCDKKKRNGQIYYNDYLALFLAPLDSRHESQNKANFPLRSVLNEPERLDIET